MNFRHLQVHCVVKYNIEFNKFAVRTHWDDQVLHHHYYSGLTERIKDIMGHYGKPTTLEEMKTLAHSINSRYWERTHEKSCSGRNKSDTPDKSDKAKSDDKKNQASSSGHNHGHNHKDNTSKIPRSSTVKTTMTTTKTTSLRLPPATATPFLTS